MGRFFGVRLTHRALVKGWPWPGTLLRLEVCKISPLVGRLAGQRHVSPGTV